MAIIKCKMCGGDLEVTSNLSVAECEFCGTKQTLPKANEDVIQNLFNRANALRLKCEFDKAEQIYEKILQQNDAESEAHWGIVMCKYGIEYVEDPKTFKRIPTCHRTSYDAVTADADYLAAIEHADVTQRSIYEAEARAIDVIQKNILSIVKDEKPFDVFICYKETDENGKRTVDSAIANDIYHQLTQEGLKVFYAAITLEDKLGQEYEPYIFAALNSAKVMLVIGTKPQYFTAVWVKNEWSRFLKLMKSDRAKLLIPCYKDMDAYELPEEFAHLQAQDMGKIGFINDVVRGIRKITGTDTPKATATKEPASSSSNAGTAPLLKRAFMFLEDGDWNSADEYCEKVLDIDPENAQAYLGKLMAELRVQTQEQLKDYPQSFDDRNHYQKALRFGDEKQKSFLVGCIDHINTRNENERLARVYGSAVAAMKSACTKIGYEDAAKQFETISHYQDAAALAKECREKAEIARKDAILSNGNIAVNKAASGKSGLFTEQTETAIKGYVAAINEFRKIPGWKDADEKLADCQKKIEELKEKAEADRMEQERQAEIARKKAERIAKRNKKITIVATSVVCAIIAFIILLNTVIIPNGKYNDAIKLMNEGNYTAAIIAFTALDVYKDSAEKITECNTAILDGKYNDAVALMDTGNVVEAYEALLALDGYKDSLDKANSIYDKYKLKSSKVGDYVFFGAYEQNNNTSDGKEEIEWLVLKVKDGKVLVISKYALDCKQYNTSYADVTWETCSLRKWLNSDFVNSAFSADEKAMIPAVTVPADKNPDYSTAPGNATQDKVFLLSIAEANQYFSSDSARQCKPTAYAAANGAYYKGNGGNGWWWLRSPGRHQDDAAYVYNEGGVFELGYYVHYGRGAVRPAMWIDLS